MGASWPDEDEFDPERAEMESHYDGGDPFVETDDGAPLPPNAPKDDATKARANVDDPHSKKNDVESGGAVAASGKTIVEETKPQKKAAKGKQGGLRSVEGGQQKTGALKRGDHAELGGMLLEYLRRTYSGLVVYDENDFYVYHEKTGLWKVIKKAELSRIVIRWQGRPVDGYKNGLHVNTSTIDGAIDVASRMADQSGFFGSAPAGIAFRNGFLAVEQKCLVWREHSADNRARWGYSFDYDINAEAGRFIAFLDHLFKNDADKAERIQFVLEWAGIALLGLGAVFGVALVLLGQGGEGKGVFSNILRGVFPDGTVSGISPHDWFDDYALAMIRGKLLNIVPEMPAKDFTETDRIKAVITGDPVKARPIREKPFMFTPKAANLWTTNNLPGTPDNSHAMARRFGVLELTSRVDPENRNVNLAAEIITMEMAGVVALLLVHAQHALARGRFDIPQSSQERVQQWRDTGDSVSFFVSEQYEPCTSDETTQWAPANPLYQHYRKFAKDHGFQPVSAVTFKNRMEHRGLSGKHTKKGNFYPVKRGLNHTGYPSESDE